VPTGCVEAHALAEVELREEKEKSEEQAGETGSTAIFRHMGDGIELRKEGTAGQERWKLGCLTRNEMRVCAV